MNALLQDLRYAAAAADPKPRLRRRRHRHARARHRRQRRDLRARRPRPAAAAAGARPGRARSAELSRAPTGPHVERRGRRRCPSRIRCTASSPRATPCSRVCSREIPARGQRRGAGRDRTGPGRAGFRQLLRRARRAPGARAGPDGRRRPQSEAATPSPFWLTDTGSGASAATPAFSTRSITVNGQSLTVVGVAAPGFSGFQAGRQADLFVPIMMKAADDAELGRAGRPQGLLAPAGGSAEARCSRAEAGRDRAPADFPADAPGARPGHHRLGRDAAAGVSKPETPAPPRRPRPDQPEAGIRHAPALAHGHGRHWSC